MAAKQKQAEFKPTTFCFLLPILLVEKNHLLASVFASPISLMRGSNHRSVYIDGETAVTEEPVCSVISDSSSSRDSEAEVLSIQNSDLSSEFFRPDELLRAFNNFKNSGCPRRFLFFSAYEWVDIPHQVFDELTRGFLAGKAVLEVPVDGKTYLFDFLRMCRIDTATGSQNLIAWIDVNGRCFFPSCASEGKGKAELGLIIDNFLLNLSKYGRPLGRKVNCDSVEVPSACSVEPRWPDATLLRDDDRFYKVVQQLFFSGMKRFAPHTVITSIHRCTHSTPSGNSRLLSFQLQKKATMKARGETNVKFGWYGTSASNVAKIMSFGFEQPNSGQMGLQAHGIGVHLSSPHSPYASVLLSEAGDDGEKHVILCRIIAGKSEKVDAGSSQDHPTSEGFDSGVDDFVNPKWYVVWGVHMNTHILPEYIVSFKPSGHFQDTSQRSMKSTGTQNKSSVMNLSFLKLFTEIGRSLPSSRMQALEMLYNKYKVGKIRKEVFIRYMRSIAGDKLLTLTIKKLRGY
ncbi:putative inactive poly [ADP-ribose] polymerase SRO3 [Apostasia shenzhenica]|uniref:Putative inactive poly [ADP-ribose] polymerase SRO3 n=1 Tax=Apostasia shenzhenica TaxID=1088818 RepID=A0A2I0A4C7_9ASPA|nr:putative inactive poly [ADP-ribose] polymerase SRO3 [Apostasia shenzhenica]